MEKEAMKTHLVRQRAIDVAHWMTFKYRQQNRIYGVEQIRTTKRYRVVELEKGKRTKLRDFPLNYSQMNYEHISTVLTGINPLAHWEKIKGMISDSDGEILRFILEYNVPLEKFIRFELASRGHDYFHEWVGYKKAFEIWLK